MPFCPKCEYEYNTGVKTCPDCNEELVATLDKPYKHPVAQPVDDSWRAVCVVAGGMKTQMAKGALDSGNIPSTVISRNFTAYGGTSEGQGSLADMLGDGNLILVPKEFFDDAQLMLQGVLGDDFIEIREE